MASPILWQNEDATITLIDIPTSITTAQGTVQHPCHDRILSSEPLTAPFAANEPKSAPAKAKLMTNSVDEDLHAEYAALLSTALQEVRNRYEGAWCLPRPFVQPPSKKRKRDANGEEPESTCVEALLPHQEPPGLLSRLARPVRGDASVPRVRLQSGQRDGGSTETARSIDLPSLISSADSEPAQLLITTNDKEDTFRYRIPPTSSFYLGDCADSNSFRNAVRQHSAQQDTTYLFDFILLDPPWPNRSVRRTHQTKGSTYNVLTTVETIQDLLLGMDLDMLMQQDCRVGIWITNKRAVRDLVLGDGGLFAAWGLKLEEEWIWLKTTVDGQPVSDLNALWRKPYEVFLLGRRSLDYDVGTSDTELKRRVVVGVPDLHSRKPSLKALIESLLLVSRSQRVLEVFARHLVAGWCSWGDECIKFNWDGYWLKT
ncbi:hypothetical protein BAUCODRAFT_38978 [Baudoinia panamericana UAMH 10762]|uniref:MT-A70-domain-containing protein n=1 Tax=Baudoinia panamericana (strain UAMH 10762) TaxID=717646 RepID=M2MZT4_BAUPA|nr:uncharacterized protein BAUCODRAFT_38978 [Baudoinia panamericana UAMH 10762]EMC91840.1 hypothetical protein BAUCODRAFT_38978 [Baudoinia panamericana UAMH 10762]